MEDLTGIAIKISNYKCFGSEECGYEELLPINLIIGRNNSGKSSLIDLIDYGVTPKDLSSLGHKAEVPRVVMSDTLFEKELREVFRSGTSLGEIPSHYSTHWEYGKRWLGERLTWEMQAPRGGRIFISINPPFDIRNPERFERELAAAKQNRLQGFTFKRLVADRDVVPEVSNLQLFNQVSDLVKSNGQGATNAIQGFLNRSSLPSALVEENLLDDLNRIFEPDAHFVRIDVQQLADDRWEVFLAENEKGFISLSQSGSGLKTVLLVLINLHLVPAHEKKDLSNYLFGFEELENNLHPALQRRLLSYLRKTAVVKGCHFFLTTHSSVAIDLFANDDQAQILHVTHDGKCASVRTVKTYVENCGVLDDLDIRASDLLQANGIVWVEGPTDRLYFNHWISEWSDGTLKEGTHYQCVFYGGRLLKHLCADDPTINLDDLVKIFRVNRNAILLIDSDKKSAKDEINQTKQRILAEISGMGGIGWVTAGREIENYIPKQALAALFQASESRPLSRYGDIGKYLDKVKLGEGKRFERDKGAFAERVLPLITKEGMTATFDLKARLNEVCNAIKKWNGLFGGV